LFFQSHKNKKLKVFLGFSFLILFGYMVYDNVENKVFGEDSGSAVQRYVDTMGAIEIIKKNPIVGIGIDHDNFIKQFSKTSLSGLTFNEEEKNEIKASNSVLIMLVYFGIPIGIFFLYALYNQTLIPHNRKLFFMITTVSVLSSPILFLAFHFTFIISGIREVFPVLRLKKISKNERL
jgi:hypothetical protein